MKSFYSFKLIFLLTLISISNSYIKAESNPDYLSLAPLPNSVLNQRETTITIRTRSNLNFSNYSGSYVTVNGLKSGIHAGTLIQSDDKAVLIFMPIQPFSYGEVVSVNINGLRTVNNQALSPISFTFTIKNDDVKNRTAPLAKNEYPGDHFFYYNPDGNNYGQYYSLNKNGQTYDTLPSTFPQITVTQRGNTAKGYIFLSNFPFSPNVSNTPYLMILDNSGNPVFYRKMNTVCMDFKMQNNNMLSYFAAASGCFYVMDTTYTVIDTFKCGNGYTTDLHELRILPNGHALIMSYDTETVDMSQIVTDGDPNARVAGLIIQELDLNKNVIFEWRSWDHFKITDATHENLTAHSIDYVHGNAIELDNDGNILISNRHMDELTKINRMTGDIIWRLGGKNNQFQFINDPIGFSHQHAIRRLPNGNITIFDNGNFHNPPFSRGVEYKLDEVRKTATLVWEYRNTPSEYGSAMGYVQRFSNGNTLIGWGGANPTVTEVDANNFKVFELNLPQGVYSYRAYRQEWKDSDSRQYNFVTKNYILQQNFPNPFNPVSYIYYSLPQEGNVRLDVFDITGRKVETMFSGYQNAGTYGYKFDGSNLASGVYFYQLRAGDPSSSSGQGFVEAKKMLLVK